MRTSVTRPALRGALSSTGLAGALGSLEGFRGRPERMPLCLPPLSSSSRSPQILWTVAGEKSQGGLRSQTGCANTDSLSSFFSSSFFLKLENKPTFFFLTTYCGVIPGLLVLQRPEARVHPPSPSGRHPLLSSPLSP